MSYKACFLFQELKGMLQWVQCNLNASHVLQTKYASNVLMINFIEKNTQNAVTQTFQSLGMTIYAIMSSFRHRGGGFKDISILIGVPSFRKSR